MTSKELKSIVNKIKEQGEMNFLKGATEEEITTFEKTNKIALPTKYRNWLQYCDGGELFLPGGVQFYGVAHKPLIDVNEGDRPDDSYVVIGALANGDPIIFEKGSDCISIYNHKANKIETDETYGSFYDFLNDLYELLGIGE